MKNNAMLARIEARAEEKYEIMFRRRMGMVLQMGQDAAMLAAHDVLGLGPGRARDFCVAYMEAVSSMATLIFNDQKDDPDFWYSKAKIDERVKAVAGDDNFAPWKERYGQQKPDKV